MPEIYRRIAVGMTSCIHLISGNLNANRFLRFLVAGGINTIFGFAAYSAAIVLGAAVWLGLLVGIIAGIAFNFFTIGGYVFRHLSLIKLPAFIICYMVVYGVNLGLIEFLARWLEGKILPQFILTFPMAALSYFLMAYFVFPKKKRCQAPPKA